MKNNIELLIVREQNNSDWVLKDGTPLIMSFIGNIYSITPLEITTFNTKLDRKWINENTDLDTSRGTLQLSNYNGETIIEDVGRNDKYSLKKLQERLGRSNDRGFGKHSLLIEFEEAYIHHDALKLKLREIDLTYHISKPIHQQMSIDFSKELVGVIEYLSKNSKTKIYNKHVAKRV